MKPLEECIHYNLKPLSNCKKCNGKGKITNTMFNRLTKDYACNLYTSKLESMKGDTE